MPDPAWVTFSGGEVARRALRIERHVEHEHHPALQRGEQPRDAADVGVRERDPRAVAVARVDAVGHRAGDVVEGIVAVARALGVARGARRVEQPAHRRVGGCGRRRGARRERRGVAEREAAVAVDHEHVETGRARGDAARHRLVVEPAPHARHDEELGAGLARAETELALAVDRDDRVLHHVEATQRGRQHHRVEAGGQAPAHDVFGPDAEGRDAGRGLLGALLELGVGDAATALVARHLDVGGGGDARVEELPEVAAGHVGGHVGHLISPVRELDGREATEHRLHERRLPARLVAEVLQERVVVERARFDRGTELVARRRPTGRGSRQRRDPGARRSLLARARRRRDRTGRRARGDARAEPSPDPDGWSWGRRSRSTARRRWCRRRARTAACARWSRSLPARASPRVRAGHDRRREPASTTTRRCICNKP